jgi:hypothetical protein
MPTKVDTGLSFSSPNIILIISGVFFGVVCAFSLGPYLNLVEQLGFRIPQDDMITDYATSLVWATFLGVCIIFSPIRNRDKHMLLWAWFIKCFVSLFVLLFEEAHYPGGDAVGYFTARTHAVDFFHDFLKAGVSSGFLVWTIIAKYNQVVPEMVQSSFHSLKISFSMLSLMAMYLFYRASILITKNENRTFFWVLVLCPSLLIWTSRIGKESLMVFTIALYTVGLVNWHFKRKTVYLLIGLIGLLSCTLIRFWVGGLMLVPLFFYFLYANKSFFTKTTCALAAGVLIFLSYNLILYKFTLKDTDAVYRKLEKVATNSSKGGSTINREKVEIKGPLDVIKYAPAGIFTALFRPLPWDMPGLLGFASGMEGLLLLYLFLKAVKRTRLRELNDPILVWAIVLVFSWALLYGFAIQNFGTGLRWKTQVLPVFLGLLCYLGRHRQRIL